MITEQQIQERKKGIFSSDVPRVMAGAGVQVFLEKIGEAVPEDIGELEYVQLGNMIEAAVLTGYERHRAITVARNLDTKRHPISTWLGAHLDGLTGDAIVEAKAVGVYNRRMWGEPGTDEVPDRVLWQVQAQMAVYGRDLTHVPVAFCTEQALTQFIVNGTVPIELYVVPRSEIMIERLIEVCGEVWGCVEAGIPPKPAQASDARLLYTKDTGEAIEGDAGHVTLLAQRKLHDAEAELAATKRDEIDATIQGYMKEAAELRYEGKTIATWKSAKGFQKLDAAELKKQQPGIYRQFAIDVPGSRRFLVK